MKISTSAQTRLKTGKIHFTILVLHLYDIIRLQQFMIIIIRV
jgi:hypothetical protein